MLTSLDRLKKIIAKLVGAWWGDACNFCHSQGSGVHIERRLQHQPIRYTYNRFESCRQTLMSGMFNVQSTVF